MRLADKFAHAACIGSFLATGACDPTRYITLQGKKSLEGSTEPFETAARASIGQLTIGTCADFTLYEPARVTPGFNPVGYRHQFTNNPPIVDCDYRRNYVHRLAVRFDLASVQKLAPRVFIKSALLSFDKRHSLGNHECADKLLAITSLDAEPGTTIRPRGEERYDGPVPRLDSADCVAGRCTMQVRGQVTDWVRGTVENMGFVLRGEDERLNANDNVACLNEYANFRLDLDYSYDVVAPTKAVPVIRIPPYVPGGSPSGTTSTITLVVTVVTSTTKDVTYKLQWTGIPSTVPSIDVYRNGVRTRTTPNDGLDQDRVLLGTTRYKVCEAGSTTACSPEVAVTT